MTDAERSRYDEEDSTYRALHGDCVAGRHSVSGSLTMHCMKCCPPPPLSPTQIERIVSVLNNTTSPSELMAWRLRLYCGHTVEKRAHRTHTTARRAFTDSVTCPECGLSPATIIDAAPVGVAEAQRRRDSASRPAPPRPTRTQLERRVAELEAEVAALRRE